MEKGAPPSYAEAAHQPPGFMPQPHMQPGFIPPPNQPQPYPNQPQPFPQQMHQPQVVMVATPPTIFGPNSQPLTCTHCHHQITTRVESESSSRTHLIAVLLCIVGCIPCCLIPYCMDSCQNRNHYCPNCGSFLGAYTNQ